MGAPVTGAVGAPVAPDGVVGAPVMVAAGAAVVAVGWLATVVACAVAGVVAPTGTMAVRDAVLDDPPREAKNAPTAMIATTSRPPMPISMPRLPPRRAVAGFGGGGAYTTGGTGWRFTGGVPLVPVV